MQDIEKLSAFYLGKEHDIERGKTTDQVLLYDAKDLTTHALCVGMTGSGKTGLGITLLEEAAIDGIPAIVIDPKGDMGNMLLGFPRLRAQDFRPWIDPGAARRKGQTEDEFAASQAALWKKGLASWGQDGARIARYRDAVDITVYTPGSTAAVPLTVMQSFDAPRAELVADREAFAERVQGAASGLLTLLGIDPDPIRSREHILLSNILDRAWRAGRNVDLSTLIREIQTPPFDRLGVLDLESFFPARDRIGLAMTLNGLLASPSFSQWLEGEPLDIDRLLYTETGKPRISILSIAHLSESERMFFVTILLNEVVSWMRSQSGTSSLRAVLYMDEIFGYFPPSAEPPTKRPMLTLLKQARAYGLGVVLSTQNPVDLDYKGLSNIGTWFIGRLQTERDKARIMDGLEGALTTSGRDFDRKQIDNMLSGLGSRVFLMNNVHEDAPVVFHTRWALSYLRGPLGREHYQALTADVRKAAAAATGTANERMGSAGLPAGGHSPATDADGGATTRRPDARPAVAPGIKEFFLDRRRELPTRSRLVYRPGLFIEGKLHFARTRPPIDSWKPVSLIAGVPDSAEDVDWEELVLSSVSENRLRQTPEEGASFAQLPSVADRPKSYSSWKTSLKRYMYESHTMPVFKCKKPKVLSEPGEDEGEFLRRARELARESRDLKIEKLRDRYTPKLARQQERIRKQEERVGKEEEQHAQSRTGSLVTAGVSLLGALFGRKIGSVGNVSRAGTAIKSGMRVGKEKADIERAQRDLEAEHAKLADLEAELEGEVAELEDDPDLAQIDYDTVTIRPRKSDITVAKPALVWTPWIVDEDGLAEPAF